MDLALCGRFQPLSISYSVPALVAALNSAFVLSVSPAVAIGGISLCQPRSLSAGYIACFSLMLPFVHTPLLQVAAALGVRLSIPLDWHWPAVFPGNVALW